MGQARPPLAVDTGPGCELPAGRLHHRPQGFNPWLRIGRIDHIGQIDSAEVINTSGQRSRKRVEGPKVRGRLEMDLRRQQRTGRRNQLQQISLLLGGEGNGGGAIGAPWLKDHLLKMSPPQLQIAKDCKGLQTIGAGFTHPQQESRREGNAQAAGLLELGQANLQPFTRGVGMQRGVGRPKAFEHQAKRGVGAAKASHLPGTQGTGIGVGQPSLSQGELAELQ